MEYGVHEMWKGCIEFGQEFRLISRSLIRDQQSPSAKWPVGLTCRRNASVSGVAGEEKWSDYNLRNV